MNTRLPEPMLWPARALADSILARNLARIRVERGAAVPLQEMARLDAKLETTRQAVADATDALDKARAGRETLLARAAAGGPVAPADSAAAQRAVQDAGHHAIFCAGRVDEARRRTRAAIGGPDAGTDADCCRSKDRGSTGGVAACAHARARACPAVIRQDARGRGVFGKGPARRTVGTGRTGVVA
jgi:hypothetical protein